MKLCVKCNLTKHIDMFGKDKTRKDGYFPYCKECTQIIKYERKGIFITTKEIDGEMLEFKNCISCKSVKAISEYPKSKIGLRNTLDECNPCREKTLEKRRKRNIERVKQNHWENRDKNIQYLRGYYQNNKNKILKKQRTYYQQNKQKILEVNRQWKIENADKWKEYHKEYLKRYYQCPNNKRKRLDIYRRYRKRNADKISAYKKSERGREVNNRSWNKRRTLEKQLLATLTKEQWISIKERFNQKCAYCLKDKSLTIDHFVPISKNGEFTVTNVLPACLSCNSSKGARDFFKWYPEQEFYCEKQEGKISKHLNIQNNKQQIALF